MRNLATLLLAAACADERPLDSDQGLEPDPSQNGGSSSDTQGVGGEDHDAGSPEFNPDSGEGEGEGEGEGGQRLYCENEYLELELSDQSGIFCINDKRMSFPLTQVPAVVAAKDHYAFLAPSKTNKAELVFEKSPPNSEDNGKNPDFPRDNSFDIKGYDIAWNGKHHVIAWSQVADNRGRYFVQQTVINGNPLSIGSETVTHQPFGLRLATHANLFSLNWWQARNNNPQIGFSDDIHIRLFDQSDSDKATNPIKPKLDTSSGIAEIMGPDYQVDSPTRGFHVVPEVGAVHVFWSATSSTTDKTFVSKISGDQNSSQPLNTSAALGRDGWAAPYQGGYVLASGNEWTATDSNWNLDWKEIFRLQPEETVTHVSITPADNTLFAAAFYYRGESLANAFDKGIRVAAIDSNGDPIFPSFFFTRDEVIMDTLANPHFAPNVTALSETDFGFTWCEGASANDCDAHFAHIEIKR